MHHGSYKPIQLVQCCVWGTGVGVGIARMDAMYQKLSNRGVVEPVFVVPGEKKIDEIPYDPDIPYIFTGSDNRFGALIELFSKADIVQFSSSGFNPLICEAARLSDVPALVEVMHIVEPGRISPRIDLTICVSETVRRLQPDREKTALIYNGIDLDAFPYQQERPPNDKTVIMQVCNRTKSCFNLDELAAEIFAIDPNVELWLVGRGQEGESTDRVKFFGLCDNVAELYRRADILFSFADNESFGLVVVEAMASGCLPIVSNNGGPAEIVTDRVNGWTLPPDDKQKILAAIRESTLLRSADHAKWRSMSVSARQVVEEKFDMERWVTAHENLYLSLMERKGRRKSQSSTNITASPDADLDDAIHHFSENRWDKIAESVKSMAASCQPVTIPLCAHAAVKLAGAAIAVGREDLALMIYQKIYSSGFRDAKWMKKWVEIMPDDNKDHGQAQTLLLLEPDNPETVLLAVDRFLKCGRVALALKALEDGVRHRPDVKELAEVLETLKQRLSPNEGRGNIES